MENDINNLDPNDEGLSAIFGDRWHDETKPAVAVPETEKSAQKVKLKPRDAEWEPAPGKPTTMDKVKACAKSALLFGGLSLMFFYWQQTEQMDLIPSMICICTCCLMVGLGVGKNVRS